MYSSASSVSMSFKMYLTKLWFSLLIFSVFHITRNCTEEETFHSTYLNITKNHKFHGRTIEIVFAEDMIICGQLCLREEKCVSFNFKNRGEEKHRPCELKDSKPSIGGMSNSPLTYSDKYDYVVLQRESQCCNIENTPANCMVLKNLGCPDGAYKINPDGGVDMTVFCDQTTDGGGWTVLQRRVSPFRTSFNKMWAGFRQGFGDINGEFWLGNIKIHRLTAAGLSDLRIDLTATGNHSGFAKYSGFNVGNNGSNYRWTMKWHSGDIGDSIENPDPVWTQVGRQFSTPDRDNDGFSGGSCASERSSGWWYNWCGFSDLNKDTGPYWNTWTGKSVIQSEMKLR